MQLICIINPFYRLMLQFEEMLQHTTDCAALARALALAQMQHAEQQVVLLVFHAL